MDRPSGGNKGIVILVVIVFLIVGMGTCAYIGVRNMNTEPPDFPLLNENPDPNLHGTVAYLDEATWCVRIVAASGADSRQVYCLDQKAGGEGPALAWLPDGRLEMIMYDFPSHQPLTLRWRKIVDVTTFEVEDASLEGLPDEPVPNMPPGPTPDGRSIMIESAGGGTISILIEDGTSYRSLLNASGNNNYGILGSYPIWSPDYEWLLVHDGRLLIVTVADPAVTRILVVNPVGFPGSGIPGVAITAADLLG